MEDEPRGAPGAIAWMMVTSMAVLVGVMAMMVWEVDHMRKQMRSIEQERIDIISEGIEENIARAKRIMEKPYTADDETCYERTSRILTFGAEEALTLCVLGIEEAYEYEEAVRECNNDLFDWRFPHDKKG